MIMEKFKEFPKNSILYVIAIMGFLIVLLVEIFVFIPIESAVSTYGILDYEFAWNAANVLSIFSAWGSNGITNQITAIYWDFLFIIGYVSLAFSLIVLVFQRSSEQVQTIGKNVLITPFLTGIFDIIENIFLLIMATNPSTIIDSNALIASLSASIKFGLLFVGIIYFVIALILIIVKKIQKRNE
ncbi:MAG: hypothetical protein ACW972_09825 [Promethearchaeota archaeon]|jgi:hypothetical protein